MNENIKWKDIKGYEGQYKISEYGDIYSLKSSKLLKADIKYGYKYVTLRKDGKPKSFRVHKLVARHFICEPSDSTLVVGHLDNNKTNNHYSNLYWTTTQENTQKAVDDKLLVNKKSEEDSQSKYIKVIDKNNGKILGVYGSMRQCARCVENITFSSISKAVHYSDDYKPISRKFKYRFASKEEFNNNLSLKDKKLIESEKVSKNPVIFRMINENQNIDMIMDNQTKASEICKIPQRNISQLIKTSGTSKGWKFIKISNIDDVKNSSGYRNQINTIKNIKIKNIETNEELEFESAEELKKYFKLKMHDISSYKKENHLILGKWKIID